MALLGGDAPRRARLTVRGRLRTGARLPGAARPAARVGAVVLAVDLTVIALDVINELGGLDVQVFDFDSAESLPTWLKSSQFLIVGVCAGLAALILAGRRRLSWVGIAAVFLFLSMDEIADLRNKITAHAPFGISLPRLPVIYVPVVLVCLAVLPALARDVREALGSIRALIAGFALVGLSLVIDTAWTDSHDSTQGFRPSIFFEEGSELLGTAVLLAVALATFLSWRASEAMLARAAPID